MKNTWKKILMMTLMCAMVIAAIPAQKTKAADDTFSLSISSNGKSVSVTLPNDGQYKEVQVLNSSKKVWKTQKCMFFTTFDLKKNKAGMVRYRYIDNDGNALTKWSKCLSFITCTNFKVKQEGKKFWASYKLPKIKGVKKYVVSISDKKDKGFKKVKSVKPGKKVVLKKCKKKAFKVYQNYYVQIKPVVKGAKYHTTFTTYFYFTRTFK